MATTPVPFFFDGALHANPHLGIPIIAADAAPNIFVRVAGAWVQIVALHVRVGGAWVQATAVHVRQTGAWVTV